MSNTRKSKPETFNKGIVTDVTEQLQPAGSYRDATNIRITSLDGKHFAAQNINGTSIKVTLNPIPGKELFVFRPKTDFTPGETYLVDDISGTGNTLGVYLGLPGSSSAAAVAVSNPAIQFVMNSVLDLYTAIANAFNSVAAITQHITFQATQDGLSYTLSQSSINAGYVLQRIIIGELGTAADPDELGDETDTASFSAGEWLEQTSIYPFTDRFVVVGHYSFVNELYLYTQDKIPGQTQFGHIHKLVFDVNGELVSQEVIYGNALTFQDTNKLIVRGIIENNCVQRLVWTDNLNPLRTINVLDDNLAALSLESLSATPQYQLSHPIVTNVTAGSLPTGMYEYGYKLLSAGGGDTSVSTLSNLVPVGLGDFDGDTFDMVGDIAIGVDNSGKGLEIKIKGLDTNFDTIKLYVIYYANNLAGAGQLFEVTEETFSGDEFTYVHSDLDLSMPLVLEEFTVQNNTWRFCKAIEVKDNILFAANLRSLPETFTFDAQIKRYKGISTATTSDPKLREISARTDSTPASGGLVTNDSSFDNSVNRYWQLPIKDSKNNAKFRRILGGHTDDFDNSDNGIRVSFHMEDRIAENKGSFGSASTNSGPITESITGQTPNPFLNGYPISVNNAQAHANPLYTSVKKGYQRGEIYRFAIVFYDRMGNPGFARYIGDIQMPNHEDDYWRFSRSNSKTAGVAGTLTCEIDANCPDYRLSYVEGFWGPAQVDKIYNGVYTDSSNPVAGGYLPKGFRGGTLGEAEYVHRLTDLYIRFEVKLSNAVKESISGFKIVRAERTNADRTVVTQGMLNPMGIAGGNDNLSGRFVSGAFTGTNVLETDCFFHSFANKYQFAGGGDWADDGVDYTPSIIDHNYNGIYSFRLMPINFGIRKNIPHRGDGNLYATKLGFAYFSGAGLGATNGITTYQGPNNVESAFQYKNSILNTYPETFNQNNEFISFRYIDASNTYKFGWPANSKATHPNYFTLDSLDVMGGMIPYQRKSGDKLKIVSVLSQFSQLRKDHGLSWRTPSGATFNAYTYNTGIGQNSLPYNQMVTPQHNLQFISEVGHIGQSDTAQSAGLPETAQFTNEKILTELGNSGRRREHQFVEWYVEDTGLYNKRAYENQFSNLVNHESAGVLDNDFDILDSEDIGFGEVKNSFMNFVGSGMVNRGAHDMTFTSWRSPEKVYTLSNPGTINNPSTFSFDAISSNGIMGESGFLKHIVPISLSKEGRNFGADGHFLPNSHYTSSYDICNPTLGLRIDGSILGINLLPEFYFAGEGSSGQNVGLPSMVSIDTKRVLDYRFDDANIKPIAHKFAYPKPSKTLFFFPHRYLCNIVRNLPNQYGGNSASAISSTRYISTGHFTAVTQDANNYSADVSGGDTFVNIFAYNKYKGMGADGGTENNGTQLGAGSVSIPIESKINFDYTHHEHFKRGDYLLPSGYPAGQEAPALSKNYDGIDKIDYYEVYSQESTTVGFLSDNSAFDCVITRFPNQIAYSNTKLSGDMYNAWDTFPPANFHDVDGNLGEINSLFLIRDNLYFLQERGVGNLLVNPRTVITDSSGGQIFTGTGDTVQDHSYFSTEFGTIHQHSVCISDNMAYWADAIHDELFSFDGRKLTSIGDITANKKFIRDIIGGYSYINQLGVQLSAYDYSNTLKANDRPLVNSGIHSVYDHKNNEAIFTFFDSYKLRNTSEFAVNKKNEVYNTIAYNEQLKLITSRYSYKPSYWISHDNRIYAISNSSTKSYSMKSKNLNLWDDELATLCTFENNAQAFSIKLILNESPSISKIFDNLDIIYEGENQAGATAGNPNPFKFTAITFNSPEMDTTQTVSYINGDVESYRYGVLKLPIRNQTATNRLRGTYITTTILENVNMTRKYNIFAIGYKYRQSNR